MNIKPQKGMQEYLPEAAAQRDKLMSLILETYTKCGFTRIYTPAVESAENLDKSDGGDNLNLIFKILKRGEKLDEALAHDPVDEKELCDLGLRYDLTLPLSRYYANNRNSLPSPFKCIQIDKVYRAERPQRGRLREFVQCDIDILGSDSICCEIELISVTAKALGRLGIGKFFVRVNDRRILRDSLRTMGFPEDALDTVSVSFDKLDKIGADGVCAELREKEMPESAVTALRGLLEKGTLRSYYGAAIKAQKDAVSSTIQVRPSAARLITMLVLWMTGRAAATGLGAFTKDEDDKKDKDDDTKDDAVYYGKVKADAIREVMVSATSELVAEITALVTLIIARRKQATHLGGVSISSSDNNVNILGKEVVSVHSETGILLDTTQRVEDASKWGAPSAVNGMRQSLGNMWPDNTVVPKPPDDGKYVVVNATRGALGLFAQDAQLVTQGQWVSQAPTHILKSSQENAPKAMLTMKDAADGSLEAKVSATGKILLTRGDANDGQSLTLANDQCILKNGSDVKYALGGATASLTTKNSALTMYSDSVSLRGNNATVECKSSAIDIDPGSSGSAKVCGITFQRTNLKADGALKLDAGIIKIG